MTPTLMGRWQTRVFLLLFFGVPVTLIFSLLYGALLGNFTAVWVYLFLVIFFGFGWDIIYNIILKFRWDHDWPPLFQWIAAIVEAIFVYLVVSVLGGNVLGIEFLQVPVWAFLLHYFTVYWVIFIAAHSFMRIVFHRWRFNGGRLI